MNKKKKIMIAGICTVMVIGIGSGVFVMTRNRKKVEVIPVSSMNDGYFGEPTSSAGVVYNAQDQNLFPDPAKTVSQVFVTKGQTVKAGDRLAAYDLSSLHLSVEMKKTAADMVRNDIASAKYRLQKLRNTVPIKVPEPTPVPTLVPTPFPTPLPAKKKEKRGDGYTVLDSITDAVETTSEDDICPGTDAEHPIVFIVTCDGEIRASLFEDLSKALEDRKKAKHDEMLHLQQEQPEDVPEEDKITDEMIQAAVDAVNVWAAIEVHDNDLLSQELHARWLVNGKRMPDAGEDAVWPAPGYIERETLPDIPEEPTPPLEEPEIEEQSEGYTAEELASMIRETEAKLKSLDLTLRRKELELKTDQEALSDGTVYAQHDGVVTRSSTPDEMPQDGSPFLTVSGSEGTYIQGEISELMLGKVKEGASFTVVNWNSGASYDANVISIDTYPTDSGSYYGGNPNASFYRFIGHITQETDLKNGDPLDIKFVDTEAGDSIWIDMAFIREQNGLHYVMKEENGKLKKQPVKVGRTMFGITAEIKEGLAPEDNIAFPYGKNVKEGAPVKVDENGGMMG